MSEQNVEAIDRDPKTGQFLVGHKGNGGRPKGARSKLGEAFIEKLQDDFNEHGVEAIQKVREERPDAYLKVIASILPKDMTVNINHMDGMTDDQLIERMRQLDKLIRPYLELKKDEYQEEKVN